MNQSLLPPPEASQETAIMLRPYQAEAVEAVYDHLRSRDDNPCVVIPTAGGKTPVMASICRDAVQQWNGRVLIFAHVKELIEQAVEKLHAMAPDLWNKIGVYSAGLGSRDTDHPIIVAGIQSVYKRAAELDAFDLILLDECFPAGTMISTPRGDTAIEDIYVGQPVHTAMGVGNVEVLSGRTTDRLIELEFDDGHIIRCTPNHRFFTEQGWRDAQALEVGSRLFRREDVQALREGDASSGVFQPGWQTKGMHRGDGLESSDVLQREMRGPKEKKSDLPSSSENTPLEIEENLRLAKDLPLLREGILPVAKDGPTGQPHQLSEGGQLETTAFLLHLLRQEVRKPSIPSGGAGKAQPNIKENRSRSGFEGGQRKADCTAEKTFASAGTRLAGRISRPDESPAPRPYADIHKTRHCQSEEDDRDRVGWCLPCDDQKPKSRPTTNGHLASPRVVRIAHIQCESPVPVFNLQVSGHPSYYANGVLAHNCHMLPPDGEGMYRTFLADAKVVNPNVRLVGLTATPYRMSTGMICGPVSKNLLNHVCYEVGVRELIVQGYLCPLKTKAGRRKVDTSSLHVRGGEFIAGEVEALMDEDSLVRSACGEIVEQTRDRNSVLIFASGVDHAIHVQRVLGEMGYECGFVCGETLPFERAETLDRFKRGDLKYLVNVNVLTTGFDAPNIDCVAMLRPTMSPGLYYQMVGRSFRLHPGKMDALVLDFGGNILRHGPVDALEIENRESGSGEAPAKECPNCCAVIHAAYATCPECGHEFPPPEKEKHDPTAHAGGILTGEVTETEFDVSDVFFAVHHKRGAAEDHPRTMRVDYRCGFSDYRSEWVCPEHTGYARNKFEAWWRARSNEPLPVTAERAVELAEAGALAPTRAITVRSVAGEKFDRIIDYQLGPIPPCLDGSDERGDVPADTDWPPADSQIPF